MVENWVLGSFMHTWHNLESSVEDNVNFEKKNKCCQKAFSY